METKFKVGDRVYMAFDPNAGGIVESVIEGDYEYKYYVREDGQELLRKFSEQDLLDLRTAFLVRLKDLLDEFDADIDVTSYDDVNDAYIRIGNKAAIIRFPITAERINNYGK